MRVSPSAARFAVAIALAIGASWAALGCAPTNEGLVISLETDFLPALEFDRVLVEVDGAMERRIVPSAHEDFGHPRVLTSYSNLATGDRLIRVTLSHRDVVLTARRVRVAFSGSRVLNVVISRSCLDVRCEASETCFGGRCASLGCVTGEEPECPTPTCVRDSDCTSETACVTPRCTHGVCLESDGQTCDALEVCHPDQGCVSIGESDDAGASSDAPIVDARLVDADTSTPCPGSVEVCNGYDDDCDGEVDEGACRLPADAPYACPAHTFSGHVYLVCTQRFVSWSDAKSACRSVGYDLVKIESASENAIISTWTVDPLWIGLNDHEEQHRFMWVDDTPLAHFADWAPWQPDDASGEQDCVAFIQPSGWDDRSCDEPLGFVCEASIATAP